MSQTSLHQAFEIQQVTPDIIHEYLSAQMFVVGQRLASTAEGGFFPGKEKDAKWLPFVMEPIITFCKIKGTSVIRNKCESLWSQVNQYETSFCTKGCECHGFSRIDGLAVKSDQHHLLVPAILTFKHTCTFSLSSHHTACQEAQAAAVNQGLLSPGGYSLWSSCLSSSPHQFVDCGRNKCF